MWEVKESIGKGRGLFATQDIPKGACILIEEPLLSISLPSLVRGQGYSLEAMESNLAQQFAQLRSAQQEEYMSCYLQRLDEASDQHNSNLMAILRGNAYATKDGRAALYPKVALINHSCQPNVLNADDETTRRIIAMRDIAVGEELLTTYIPLLLSTAERNDRLRQYGFRCECLACHTKASDQDRHEAGKALASLENSLPDIAGKPRSVKKLLLAKAISLATYVQAQGFADYYEKTSRLAYEYATRAGDKPGAKEWAKRHQQHHETVMGHGIDAKKASELLKGHRAK